MKQPVTQVLTTTSGSDEACDYRAPLLGEITSIDDQGRASVVYPGNLLVPVPARCLLETALPPEQLVGAQVLLSFENGNPGLPIIMGLVRNALCVPAAQSDSPAVVTGRQLRFDAEEELVFRCGQSTLMLRQDGRVLIRGTHLVSRSSGPNRIKGATVNIN